MKRILSTLMLTALLAIFSINATAQNSFNYQAVIREGGKVLENKSVSLRFSVMLDNKVYYSEQHAATTNAYGNVSVSVGEGKPLIGKFEDIPWESMRVMMQIEISTDGTDNYTNMGSMQIQPVPYTMYATRTTTVIQPAEASEEPIFQVKDNAGNLLFAVYETGVKVYVDGDNTKAAKSKFAVAGRTASKGEEDLLTIDAEGATVFVDDNYNDDDNTNADDNAKAAKSKFAVAGRSAKGDNNIITIDGSGSTIYVGGEGKAAKSKFAVAGRSAKKAAKNNYSLDGDGSTVYVDFDDNASKGNADVLSIDGGQATFYVDDTDEGKAAKSKFAVAGRSANKDVQTAFIIDGSGTLIYIDDLEGDKAAKSKFAVAGRSTSKGNDNFFTIDRDSTRIYINDEPVAADTTGIGSGITPTTPSFASAFAIVGMTKKNDLLVVNKDSAIVKTNTYIAEDIQSSTGEVEKLPDDTKADKVYTTGEFLLELQGKYGSDYDEVNYTYYRNGADEYLYLCEHFNDEHYEYRNYWLVDGKIYRDTTYLKSWNGLVPIYTYRNDFGEYFNGCRWKDYWGTEPFVAEGGSNGGLLTILESKIRQDGYKVRAEEGVNLYYKIVENEEWPAAETERNTVTALYDVDIFNSQNYLTTFKMLLEPSVAIMGKDFGIEDIAYIEWNANYTFLDSCVTSQNIVDMEYELGSYTVYDDEGNPVYDEDNPMKLETEAEVFQCKDEHRKYTLDEIDYMFYALKKGFVVMVSPTEGGTVTGIDGGNGTYNYGDKITLKAEPNDGYIFLGWNDGSIENPRTIAVMGHTTVWANFQSQSDYELVDLGLTTKWAKSNLGALSSTSAGGYYAWGETGTKSAYTQSTYTLESSSDFRDAATTILGNNYRMPAIEDWIALKDSCNWEYDSDKGCFKVSSKKNSNYIYIPATGYFDDYDGYQDFVPDDSYSNCYYLSRSEDSYYYFKTFLICSDAGDSQVTERYKYYGYQIRPVANTYNVTLVADGNGTVSGGGIFNAGATTTITATPGDGYCFVRWSDGNSDNPRLLAVTEHTNLEAVFADIIYVSQANPDLETHNGSEEFPYSSIAEAVSAMESDKNYEIRVVGTIEGPQVISDCPAKVLSLTGYGDNAKLDGKGSAANPATTLSIAANTVIIKNLTITGGYAAGSNNAAGIDVSGNVTIDQGVVVTGNTAVNGASIVYVDGSELHIQGGRIVGNTAENAHKGVYLHGWGQNVRATLCLSGNPVVEDIYPSYIDNWPDYHQVTLEGNLSGDASINITPYDYYVGLNLVISYVSMADNREYFTITPNSEGHDWTITDEGTLSYNCTLTFNVNGNVVETRKVLYGEKTEAPDMPQNPYTNEYVFAGWYYENTNEGNMFVAFDFENESVGQDNMQLQPKWLKPSKQLVVNTSLSNNIDADGTAEKPFNHIQNAIAAIELFDNPDWEYTITVTGMDSKSVNIGSDYGDTFPAKSVLLKGSGSGNNGIGLSGDNINPVCIYTSAQVKFEDFKLEFNGSVTDYVEAMALIVGREADVTLINTEIAGCDNQQEVYGGVVVHGKLTMNGASSIHNFKTKNNNAGGVHVEGDNAEMTMNGTSSIYNCHGKNGGAIYLNGGKVTMNNQSVIGGSEANKCTASSYGYGGAVYVQNGSFEMNGSSSISYCTKGGATTNNSVVWIENGEFIMNNGSIHNNTGIGVYVNAKVEDGWYGTIETHGEFIMKGGCIKDNTSYGVYVDSYSESTRGVFDMRGGTIQNNGGSGVYVTAYERNDSGYCGIFRMSGSAFVDPETDDVFLKYSNIYGYEAQAQIIIDGPLTHGGVVAKITPQDYDTDQPVLAVENGVSLANVYQKFDVESQVINDFTIDWEISKEGYLYNGFVSVPGTYFNSTDTVANSHVFIANREIAIQNLFACDHEVTQGEYEAVMNTNPSENKTSETGNYPVENVSWLDAINYCNSRSAAENLTSCYTIENNTVTCNFEANGYRLPTEVEWEYLAREGKFSTLKFSGSDKLDDVAWHDGNSGGATHEVKKKAPNSLGIFDMSGNVWEWCWDWYSDKITTITPETGVATGTVRILRGGSFANDDHKDECSVYYTDDSQNNYERYGFRVVRTVVSDESCTVNYQTGALDTTIASQTLWKGYYLPKPAIYKPGYEIEWYINNDFSEEHKYDFSQPLTGGVTLYAKPTKLTSLHVKGCLNPGSDTKGTGSADKPLATLSKALTLVTESNQEYTIIIDGELTGTQVIGSSVVAQKLTLKGKNELLNGVPQDSLKGSGSGSVLTINNTTTPIVIENLKITGGYSVQGGGICNNGGTLTLESGTLITRNNSDDYNNYEGGAGLFTNGGTVTINSGAVISSNTARNRGGGLALMNGARVTLNGGEIKNNETYRYGGAVMFCEAQSNNQRSTFTMESGTISGNKVTATSDTDGFGGGIYIIQGEFILKGGDIINNTAGNTGGAIHNDDTFTMQSGTLSGNKATYGNAGAISNYNTINITGGTISGNSVTSTSGKGKAIYQKSGGTFKMGGSAQISADNDVYLDTNQKITITSNFDSNITHAATITLTPSSYVDGTQVLDGNYSQNEYKFEVTPYNGSWTIYLGCLNKQQ